MKFNLKKVNKRYWNQSPKSYATHPAITIPTINQESQQLTQQPDNCPLRPRKLRPQTSFARNFATIQQCDRRRPFANQPAEMLGERCADWDAMFDTCQTSNAGPKCNEVAEKIVQLFGWRQTYNVEKLQRDVPGRGTTRISITRRPPSRRNGEKYLKVIP